MTRGVHVSGIRAATAWAWGVVFGMSIGVTGGCIPEPEVSFDSPAPTKRIDAIARASRQEDRGSLVKLVEKLGSSDPVERMLAIRSLERREGETLGYDHAAPKWERLEAIERWRGRLGIEEPLSDGDGGANAEPPIDDGDGRGGGGASASGKEP